ncbi:MAG: pilus assembly protein PilM [Planctomycetes bacterium]|nr:pilus assembly protein PilM [Planctomycetota bacterium]
MFLSAKKQYGPIAVDLGAACLRAVQLERRGGRLAVRHWMQVPVPHEGLAGAEGKDGNGPAPPAPLPRLDREAFLGDEVVVSLHPPEVECTPLRVPDNLLALGQAALVAAIRHEVSRNISLPVDEVEMDVWRLGSGQLDSPNLMVAAARRDRIQRTLAWLDDQKLVCRRIDVGPLVALRACAGFSAQPNADHLWGVLDVGKSAVRLYIGVGEVPVYVRCMARGGEEMTRRISEDLGVSRGVSESYKRHYGVQSAEGHYRPASPMDDAVEGRRMAAILLGVLRPIIRSIGEEVQRSFRYAMGLYPDRPISGLWVIGGGAGLAGLTDLLAEMLGIAVHRVTAGHLGGGLIVPPTLSDETVPQLAACLGLCLGEMN